jgi:putative lipoic acid-binding regulatory protein
MENQKSDEFYKNLKTQIDDTTKVWPSKFLYKFILLTDELKIKQLESYFNHMGAVITKKPSKNGKYTSISILADMKCSNDIIKKYKEVSQIKGIISL